MPKISVIVPIYRVEKYLRRCLDSLARQSFEDLEFILIDDGSDDACPEICDIYAKTDRRFKVIHKENAGVCAARNDGMDLAEGEYIAFFDPDDFCLPVMYEKLYAAAKATGENDIVKCGAYVILENELPKHFPHTNAEISDLKNVLEDKLRSGFVYREQSFPAEFIERYIALRLMDSAVWNILIPSVLAKKVKFGKPPGDDAKYIGDISHIMEEYGGRIYLIKPLLYIYNLRNNSITTTETGEITYLDFCENHMSNFFKFPLQNDMEEAKYFYNWTCKIAYLNKNRYDAEFMKANDDKIKKTEEFIVKYKSCYDLGNPAWHEADYRFIKTIALCHPAGPEARL